MQRRDILRLLGGASILAGIAPRDLLALGESTHRLIRRGERGFFDPHQMHTVAAAGDRILPVTDTPGALAADCHHFSERIVADHFAATRQRRFIAGLVDLDQRASRLHRHLFIDCSPAQQDVVLSAVESDAYAADNNGQNTFWRDLKWLTLTGYYTSQIGIEQELQSDRMPGRFDGAAALPDRR